MYKILITVFFILSSLGINAQFSGVINVPSTAYPSLATAISALNTQSISASVTIAIAAGYTETAPAGGFILTVSGTSIANITFKKSGAGANPLLSAYAGSFTPGSATQDGIWRLIGCDYITIDAIDLEDPNNTNPQTMEFGFGFFKASGSDGCQFNTIKNCIVTLNRINNATGNYPAIDGSRGIELVNALSSAHSTSLVVNSTNGSHSENKFFTNTIRNCNYGFSLIGFADASPYNFADHDNVIGGTTSLTGNMIIDFGGGGTTNAAGAIRTFAQYDLNISRNLINNNSGNGSDHSTTLRGIYLNGGPDANVSVLNNTLTVSGGGTSSQVTVIENNSGSGGLTNTISINGNQILNSCYSTAISGSFYGIINTANASVLKVNQNVFNNNSSTATSGGTYLIYNSGNIETLIDLSNNTLGFVYFGQVPYSGTFYNIYNTAAQSSASLSAQGNIFAGDAFVYATGTGNIYFIYNTADLTSLSINSNKWNGLALNHSGGEYFMYNTSSTQSVLSVCNNSITNHTRTGGAGNIYGYYGTATSPGTAVHTFSNNLISQITATVQGSGNFYGLYNGEGNVLPYPQKTITQNTIANITMNSSVTCFGIYMSDLGDAGLSAGSVIQNNHIQNNSFGGDIYGLHIASPISTLFPANINSNIIGQLTATGPVSSVFGTYLTGNNAGYIYFRNKIYDLTANGISGNAFGLYSGTTSTTTIFNNIIGNIFAPQSTGANRVNGIYLNSGSTVNLYFNTVRLNATSVGGHFSSNGLYVSSSAILNLKNNIIVNNSVATGTGVTAAYRRSSSSLSNYSSGSDNNIFYSGTPSANSVIFHNGLAGYQTLSTFQSLVAPREVISKTQNIVFDNLSGSSSRFLHLITNVNSLAESGAGGSVAMNDDYETEIRHGASSYSGSGTAKDIGADEFEMDIAPCNAANAGTLNSLSGTLCAGQSFSVLATGYESGTGVTHQWKSASVSSGPFQNVTGGVGVNSSEYYSPPLNPGTYFFLLETSCATNSSTAVSSQVTVVVNTTPTVTAAASVSVLCVGQTLSLSALSTSLTSFDWTGPAGFYSSLQNPVIPNIFSYASGVYSVQATKNNCVSAPATVTITVSNLSLTLNASAPNICLGGSATLTALSSGSVMWSNSSSNNTIVVSPTISSVYSVTATNSLTCTSTRTIAITVINPTITGTGAVTCGTSSTATLSVTASNLSTVNWYSTATSTVSLFTGLKYAVTSNSTTVYYAEATSNIGNCKSIRVPVTLTVSAFPILNVSATPTIICPAKISTLTVSGAVSYSWHGKGSGDSIQVKPTVGTIYTVTGSDFYNCKTVATISLGILPTPTLQTSHTTLSVCPSSVTSFTAAGAVSYTWSNGATGAIVTVSPAVNITYTVRGSNSFGCESQKSIAVATKSLPVISIIQTSVLVCPGEKVNFSAKGASTYTWLPGNIVAMTFTAAPLVTAVYNSIGKSVNGCTNIAVATVEVDPCTDLSEHKRLQGEMLVFPNPGSGLFFLRFGNKQSRSISVFNSLGQQIVSEQSEEESIVLDLTSFNRGLYFLHVETTKGNLSEKIVFE